MKPRPLKIALIASVAAALGLATSAAATPISASMNLTARATIDSATDTQSSNDSWGTLLDPLSVSATATVAPAGSGFSVSAFGQGSATWGAGGNSGIVQFNDYGWNIATGGSGLQTTADLNSGGNDWTYAFVADASGTFTMNYDVAGIGDTFGLWGWSINWSGPGGGIPVSNAFDPTVVGVFSRPIVAGQMYTIALANNANIAGQSGLDAVGSMNGTFEWSTQSAVPEPTTLALLGAGLVAVRVRRRRSS